MKTESTFVVEFDGENNQQFLFQPLGKRIRGRFDVHRVPNGGKLLSRWGAEPIPSQRLEFNPATGDGAILEPLWDAQHSATRERIERQGRRLPPGREVFNLDPATCVYWLRPLIESGKAKVIQGDLPDRVDGVPQKRFHSTAEPEPLDRLTDVLEKLLNKLSK